MKRVLLLLTFLFFTCLIPSTVFASEGTIDSVYKYGWSDEIGWVNFGNSYGNVTINDTTITGYAWNDNYGWISLAPTYGGVTNTTGGNVGGYAWGQNTGWINFDNVVIGCSGQFSGTATGDVIGTINFECTNCKVVTNWEKAGCGGNPSHNVCNSQQQCVSVSGSGTDQCSSSSDCAPPQCSDNADNDSDGATDFPNDFSCSSATDNDETNPKAQCQDGTDNDGDGLTDYPADTGCASKQDNSEANEATCRPTYAGVASVAFTNGLPHSSATHVTLPAECTNPSITTQTQNDAVLCGTSAGPTTCPNDPATTSQDLESYPVNISSNGFDVILSANNGVWVGGTSPDYNINWQVVCGGDQSTPVCDNSKLVSGVVVSSFDNGTSNSVPTPVDIPNCGNAVVVTQSYSHSIACGNSSGPAICPNDPGTTSQDLRSRFSKALDLYNFTMQLSATNNVWNVWAEGTSPQLQVAYHATCQNDVNGSEKMYAGVATSTYTNGQSHSIPKYVKLPASCSSPSVVVQSYSDSISCGTGSGPTSCAPNDPDTTSQDVRAYASYITSNGFDVFLSANSGSWVGATSPGFQIAWHVTCKTAPQCSDNIDNDSDGATDFPNDFSCSSATDNDETNPKAQCQDSSDNDGDGLTDYPADTGCASKQDNNETNSATLQCQDGIDNDNDGATDFPNDFSCSSATDNDETNPKAQCQDGTDNDGDGLADTQDPGCANEQDDDESNSSSYQCSDGIDNDNDGATDYPNDFSCSSATDNDETNPKAQCQDGSDNDGDGLTDYPADTGCASKQDNNETDTPTVTHKECGNQQCVIVDGEGTNQCSTSDDCASPIHNECNSQQQCIVANGTGSDQCQTNNDCVTATHKECSNLQCIIVDGAGTNQCSTNSDCTSPVHNECNSQQQCVVANGAGGDQCQTNSDCGNPTDYKHSECNKQKQCILVSGPGNNQCQSNSDCDSIVSQKHSACNAERQCILVDGVGSDQCQTDNNCKNPIIPLPIDEIITGLLPPPIKDILVTPIGSLISKATSTTGVIIATTVITTGILAYPVSLLEIFLILARLFSFLLLAFGIKRKANPWGVVYDSVTKQPIDPAYVTLKNVATGKTYSAITDIDGRYGFLAEPGIYIIVANKTNYSFPSQKLAGKIKDELYDNLYFGSQIEIKKQGDVIINNIPLDPVKFDWNEFAKKDKALMKFYSRWDLVLRRISNTLFVIGFAVAIVAFFVSPYPYNTVVLGLYLFLLLLRVLGIKPNSLGYITDKATNAPLSFAIVRIMLPDSNIEISHKIADKYGRYYCLIPKGRYYVKIETKNSDESYSLVYTSPIIDASKSGIIKTSFKI